MLAVVHCSLQVLGYTSRRFWTFLLLVIFGKDQIVCLARMPVSVVEWIDSRSAVFERHSKVSGLRARRDRVAHSHLWTQVLVQSRPSFFTLDTRGTGIDTLHKDSVSCE